MALWRCRRCGCKFAVGLPYCPQCTSTDAEEDDGMPKITRHGGPSDATTHTDSDPGDAGDGTGSGAAGEPSRPGANDRKNVWATWAVDAGYDPGYVADLTKAELADLADRPSDDEVYVAWLDAQTTPDDDEEEGEGAEDGPADGTVEG